MSNKLSNEQRAHDLAVSFTRLRALCQYLDEENPKSFSEDEATHYQYYKSSYNDFIERVKFDEYAEQI